MVSLRTGFPWLVRLGCGCQFSRFTVTDGSCYRSWDPCGAHVVLAATGHQPGWPPRIETRVTASV